MAAALVFSFSQTASLAQDKPSGEKARKDAQDADNLPVCLLTGHEPFDNLEKNPSWETAKALEGKVIAGHRIAAVKLPVVYDEVAVPLEEAITKHRPRMVIAFGVGWNGFEVETIARNGYHPDRHKDNKDRRPPREKIDPKGKELFTTELPAESIVKALEASGIGARTSKDAGGYLCNETFYRLMNLDPKGLGKSIKMHGFVHTPNLNDTNPKGGKFTKAVFKNAYTLIIQQAASQKKAKAKEKAESPAPK